MLSKNIDGQQDYQRHVNVFVAWKDGQFQKTYNKLQEASV